MPELSIPPPPVPEIYGVETRVLDRLPMTWRALLTSSLPGIVVAGGAIRWAIEQKLGLVDEPLRDIDLFVQDRDVAARIQAFIGRPPDVEQPGRYKWTSPDHPTVDLVYGPGGRSRAELWLARRPTIQTFAEDLIASFDLSASQAAMWFDAHSGYESGGGWIYRTGEHFEPDVKARRLRLVGKIEDTNVHRLFRFFERGYKPDPDAKGGDS